MIPHEIHITARPQNETEFLAAAKELAVKTISIDLLTPEKEVLRSELMTSIVKKFENYSDCSAYVDYLVSHFISRNCEPLRVKIESPWIPALKNQALYIESHFVTNQTNYPISRNIKKTTLLATDRTYQKEQFENFFCKWFGKADVELCLYDSFCREDQDWFDLWPSLLRA